MRDGARQAAPRRRLRAGRAASAEPELRTPRGVAGEVPDAEQRRTVTVLFADLSGYTAISERLDHETVKALVERCLTRLTTEVERYGGRVDKYIGDNVMAVFGAPLAHEDDPSRAVRAALGMQEAMAELARSSARSSGWSPSCGSGSTPGRCWPVTSAGPTRSSATPSTSPRGCRPPRRSAACWSASARAGSAPARSPTAPSSRSR